MTEENTNVKMKIFQYLLIALVFILIGWFANTAYHLPKNSNPIAQIKPTPLNKYTIDNLSKIEFTPSLIEIGKVLKDNPKFTSYEFTFSFSPDLSGSLKKTSGLINIPKGKGPFPVIVMFRGYVDQKEYKTGEGTMRAGEFFAQKGFLTLAPDFLGYGDSDPEASDIFESRFQTYVTAATLLKSLDHSTNQPFNYSSVGIWAHSNGGQITLTALEITGTNYPTVLWAPVSMPFPGSILYYTFESDDQGKYIVKHLADFNDIYDFSKFSLTNYLGLIKAPIQLNQGTNDQEVPFWISDTLSKNLKEASVSAIYIKYPENDHNMHPNWDAVVQNNLTFFNARLAK